MTGLRERLAEALTGRCARPRVTAAAVLGVLGDQDTLALIARVLDEHRLYQPSYRTSGCKGCDWRGYIDHGTPTGGAIHSLFAAHQAAAVVAALTEEQT